MQALLSSKVTVPQAMRTSFMQKVSLSPLSSGCVRVGQMRASTSRALRVFATAGPSEPTNAETAKTVVSLVGHGTLSMAGEDGFPSVCYAQFTLDESGHPLLLVNKDIPSGTKCALFVQAPTNPTRRVARVSLFGAISPAEASEKVLGKLAERREAFGSSSSDSKHTLYRLAVSDCHVSKGLVGNAETQAVNAEDFSKAEVDVLAACAAQLAVQMNGEREEDLMRLAASGMGIPFDSLQAAEMLWADQYGVTMRVWTDNDVREGRVTFLRPARDERDARSLITMMAQAAWEAEKK